MLKELIGGYLGEVVKFVPIYLAARKHHPKTIKDGISGKLIKMLEKKDINGEFDMGGRSKAVVNLRSVLKKL